MNRLRQGIIAIAVGALLLGAGVTAQATSADVCEKVFTANSIAKLQDYLDCREDRQDAALKRIEDRLNSAPTPTPEPSSPAPSSPAPTTPAPTTPAPPPTGTCTNPSITFQNTGSRGVGDGYDISAEPWSTNGYNYAATLRFCSKDSWNVSVTTDDAKKDGAVKSYPSIRKIYHDWSHTDFSKDPRLSSFAKLTVDFAATDPADCTGCIYDTAFDIWANGIGGSNNTELMIWTSNVGQRPYGSKVASGIAVDGRTWDLWSGNSDHYIAYVPTDGKRITSGTLDVKAFLQDLISRNRIAATNLPGGTTDPYIGQVSFGVEPVSTNGVSRTWNFTRFNVNES